LIKSHLNIEIVPLYQIKKKIEHRK